MLSANDVNALQFLRSRNLPPLDMNAVTLLLSGDLAGAKKAMKAVLACDEYSPPKDDIAKGLGDLLAHLRGCLKREDYTAVEAMIGQLMAASRKRVEDHETEINTASNSNTVAAADAMMPNVRKLLNARDTSSSDSIRRLHGHLARLEPNPNAGDDARRKMLQHMDRIGIIP